MMTLNDDLHDKLDDAENRAQRDISFRCVPEAIIDLQGMATDFFQELAPEIPLEHLKFDHIHRSLAPKPAEGPQGILSSNSITTAPR